MTMMVADEAEEEETRVPMGRVGCVPELVTVSVPIDVVVVGTRVAEKVLEIEVVGHD
jgi:hypothetical protein